MLEFDVDREEPDDDYDEEEDDDMAAEPMTKEKLISAVAKAGPELYKARPCAYGGLKADGTVVFEHFKSPCHASLGYNGDVTGSDQIVTSFMMRDDEGRTLAFFDFMKNHLYRRWANYIHLEMDPKSGLPYILLSDTSKIPAPVLYNLCICSRVPVEWYDRMLIWYDLVQAGVNPGLAFVLSDCTLSPYGDKERHVFNRDEYGRLTGGYKSLPGTGQSPLDSLIEKPLDAWAGHRCFDATLSIEQIMRGDPFTEAQSWKESPTQSRPTNVIWGKTQDVRNWANKTVRQIMEQHALKPQADEAVA